MKALLITFLSGLFLFAPSTLADSEEGKSAIEKATAKWAETWNKKDASALANFYTHDAVLLPPNSKPAKGREEIKAYWESNFRNHPNGSMTMESVDVEMVGDSAIQINTFKDIQDGKITGSGKGITHWKREDGEWKMRRDTWNDDKPASALPAGKLSEELQHLADDIGTWDISYLDEQGNSKTGEFVMEVDPSGKSITGHWKEPEGYGRIFFYFDPNSQRTMSFMIGPKGGIGLGRYPQKSELQEQEFIVFFHGFTSQGEPMASWDHFKHIDKNTMEHWSTDFVIAGKKIPDVPKFLFKKRK